MQRGAPMQRKRTLGALFVLVSLGGCSFAGSYETVVNTAATQRSPTNHFTIRRVNDWTFAVHEGPRETYYSCDMQVGPEGTVRCCYTVESEAVATAVIHPSGPTDGSEKTCEVF
jgi:hypothetical protein